MTREEMEIINSYTPEEAYAIIQEELKNLGIECPDFQNREKGKLMTFNELMGEGFQND
jgi:hypothetical protein